MIFLKTNAELEIIRTNGVILGKAHAEVAKIIKPGVTTKELDKVAFEYIKDNQGHPSFLNMHQQKRENFVTKKLKCCCFA